ncbi:MerR family transcriptional regulator [Tuberibacillus sp. Marseille-P3662]|uniref:MerR family transcriptional regulator n=1 Tax=Tuberibacillus sp. Marseille-P3662 TaxID=1965358 RepID=UPI000A1C9ABC|nr:MerR family transcriptional regulator [Tuberibacillus sp. Marseille-P3662]
MQIKEAAKHLDTTPRTIRYYEQQGLVLPEKKADNQYREFTDHDLWRLQTILALRQFGIPVKTIKHLLNHENEDIGRYLDIQRSILYEEWLEMKDMLATLDDVIQRQSNVCLNPEDLSVLARHLKSLKDKRKDWNDRWDFDSQAGSYDQSIKTTGYRFNIHQDYQQALRMTTDWLCPQAGDVLLDIGIGTGNLADHWKDQATTIIGIDQSEEMLKVCAEKHPAFDLRKGHFLALPLMDHTVNAIGTSYALHHLPDDDKLLALEEMDRVLKQGGRLCIADLMFIDQKNRRQVIHDYEQAGDVDAIDAINDEYFANRFQLVDFLQTLDYDVKTRQINHMLHIVYAKKS